MPSDLSPAGSRSAGLTDDERRRVARRPEPVKGDTGAKSVAADGSKTAIEYLRRLRGMEIEQVARKAGLPVGVIERLEKGGGTATLIGNEKSAIKRVFGRSVEDLARPLTDDVKTALLHGLPLEKSGDK